MVNRRCVILLYVFFISFVLNAQSKFVLEGTADKKFEGAEIYLNYDDGYHQKTNVQNGRFQIIGIIGDEFAHAKITVSEDGNSLLNDEFFLKPGKIGVHLKESVNGVQASYVNVPFYSEKRNYDSLLLPIDDSIRFYISAARKMDIKYNKHTNDSLVKYYTALKITRKIEFVESHPESFMSLYIIYDLINSDRFGKVPINKLGAIYSNFSDSLKQTILGGKTSAILKFKQSLLIGNEAKDFQFVTKEGFRYYLSSFKGKNPVLLCFWASWCKGCIASLPKLKEIYKEYESKGVQLISISIDDDVEKWLQALSRYNMSWLQTCDLPQFISGGLIRIQFDIKSVPQYFLIDLDGRIQYNYQEVNDSDDFAILINTLRGLFAEKK